MPADFSIAVLISGGGTTLKNLIEHRSRDQLEAEIVSVVSSSAAAGGLQFAEQARIPTAIVNRNDFASTREFSERVFDVCRTNKADLVVMGGFLRRVTIPTDFTNRVINIHPSLIPSFCGKGMYGIRVHQAAIDYGVKLSGCTVHFVDDEYDHGPIIAQETVEVLPGDTPDALAKRVFEKECELYPKIINAIAAGTVTVVDRTVGFSS